MVGRVAHGGDGTPPRVAFSKPMTLRGDVGYPPGMFQIADEGLVNYSFGKKIGFPWCEYATQAVVVWRLLASLVKADILISGRYGDLFALLRGLLPVQTKKYILLEPEWLPRHASRAKKFVSVVLHRLIARGAHKIQVICEQEAVNYAEYYGIARDKFAWIPYCTDESDEYQAEEGDYIFSGGRNERDWETLYHAVKDLDIEVRIAAPAEAIDQRYLSDNMVPLGKLGRQEYFSCLAKSKLVVLSVLPGVMRYPGVITYVYALRMGKCVIVNDTCGARSYIEDEVTGIMVPPSNPQALHDAIRRTLRDHELRRSLSEKAQASARERFSNKRYVQSVHDLALQAARPGGDEPDIRPGVRAEA